MKFVKWEDLRSGMRLARPIYNKNGVLLFERDSRLSSATIESVKNFGLLGIYILEPAEPLPPMSEEDLEFERFEIKMVSSIQAEIEKVLSTKHQKNLPTIVSQIIRAYGHLDGKVHLYQNLRSRDDYVYRHMFNTAILCAMIASKMNVSVDDRLQVVSAALIHDIGAVKSQNPAVYGAVADRSVQDAFYGELLRGCEILEESFGTDGIVYRRICQQAIRAQMEADHGEVNTKAKMITGAKILMVAGKFDRLTAMSLNGQSESEVRAVQEFLDHPEFYDPAVVKALIDSIYVVFPGVSVELNTGEKALVISENPENILQPTVLSFRDNSILDLSLPGNSDIRIKDVMKTLDNRYIMNTEKLDAVGVPGAVAPQG